MCLLVDEIEQNLLYEFTVSDQISSSEDDSSGTDDLTVDEVIISEYSDEESDDVQCASSAPSATFMWKDMTNYVGQREIFFDNCGPQNEAQNETHCTKVFKMFFDDELVELIICETNTYAAQKIQARSFIPLRSRMRDWKPSTKDEMYVMLALSRKDVPQRVKAKNPNKVELVAQHTGPVSILKWKVKKDVTMISTYHGQETRI
jgi:hypothetical protein